MTRKIDAMHKYFGVAPGEHCKGCCHCISGQYRGKNYRKCDVYGMTHSEATDRAQSWLACGLYNKPYSGERVMDRALYDATNRRTAERREAEAAPIDGQIDLLGGAECDLKSSR